MAKWLELTKKVLLPLLHVDLRDRKVGPKQREMTASFHGAVLLRE